MDTQLTHDSVHYWDIIFSLLRLPNRGGSKLPLRWLSDASTLKTRAVTVLKPKTEVLRRNRTATEPRFSGAHVTVFLEFQKWPSPFTNVLKQQPNYCLSRTPASTIWSDRLTAPSGVARHLITRRDKSTFVLLSAPSGLTRTYRWTRSHADKYVNGGEKLLFDVHVSMRDHHGYCSLQLKKKKHVIHPMQINIEKKLL